MTRFVPKWIMRVSQLYQNKSRVSPCVVTRRISSHSSECGCLTNTDIACFLQHVNTASETDLQQWSILSAAQVRALVGHRHSSPPFRELNDVLAVRGLGQRTLRKFTAKFLDKDEDDLWPPRSQQGGYKLPSTIIHPRYVADQLPKSVVSVGIQLDSVYWARITDDLVLTDWSYRTLEPYMRRRYDHVIYQNTFWRVLQSLPMGEVYLLEDNPSGQPMTLVSVPGAMSRARMETTLTTMLNLRENAGATGTLRQTVHKLKHAEVGHHYDLMVGGEKVSCQKLAVDIIKHRSEKCALDVHVARDQWMSFVDSKAAVKEHMCSSFLQGVMFYELLIRQNSSYEDKSEPNELPS